MELTPTCEAFVARKSAQSIGLTCAAVDVAVDVAVAFAVAFAVAVAVGVDVDVAFDVAVAGELAAAAPVGAEK